MFGMEWSFDHPPGEWLSRRVLAEGLADLEPGEELADRLEGVDRRLLNGHELITLLQARIRQISHLQAELYADMWELAFTPPGNEHSPADRLDDIDEFASDEIAAALRLTPRQADNQLSLAYSLSELPRVWHALCSGRIDLDRARALCRETSHLDWDEAREIIDELLDRAGEWTVRQLADRVRRRCLEKHPDKARKRYEEGIAERRVESHSNPDGTADLCARQLPPHRVAAITERIHTLANHLKRHGDARTIDQIRADILMDLLESKGTHDATGRGGVEIRVNLTTLLGLDEDAADIPGWGPVIADIARQVARQQENSRWTYTVTDPDTGEPVQTGVTRRRPTTAQARHVRARNATCAFPGCPYPATRCHLDHTVDYHQGGRTSVINLGPLCARHHLRSKHRGGWRLTQPQPGVFRWISPRGHRYTVEPAPP